MEGSTVTSFMNVSPNSGAYSKPPSMSYVFGCWVKTNILWILLIASVLSLLFIYGPALATAEINESNSIAAYMNAARHRACKGKGGCGKECPFIDRQDPRVTCGGQLDHIIESKRVIDLERKSEKEMEEDSKEMGSTSMLMIHQIKDQCSINISNIYSTASKIISDLSVQKSVNASLLKQKNRVDSLEFASKIVLGVFISATVAEQAIRQDHQIRSLSKLDSDRIKDYDAKVARLRGHLKSVEDLFLGLVAKTSATSDFNTYLQVSYKEDSSTDDQINAMAMLINMSNDMSKSLVDLATHYEAIDTVFTNMVSNLDSFSNDVPGKLDSETATNLIESGDYGTALIKTALEPEIVSNHMKFAQERNTFDSGGGVPSVRDDDNDLIPWVGIFGRPSYRRSDGTSVESTSDVMQLKSIPSDVPESLMRAKNPRLSLA